MKRYWTLPGLVAAGSLAAEPVMEEVQVVARRNLLGQSVSGAISVTEIGPQQQVSLNRTVADWIERLPGVSLNGQGGLLQSYSVRGFSRWRVRTELDGVPIITDRRAGNSASFVPPALIGNTTVQRGPASALYGSGAMGGVISLETLVGDGLAISGSGQTDDEQATVTAVTGVPQHYTAAVSYRRANQAEDARGRPLDSDFEQLAGVFRYRTEVAGRQLQLSWLPSRGEDIGKSSAFYPERRVSEYPEELHSVTKVELRADDRWLAQLYHHFQDWQSDTVRLGSRRNETDYQAHTVGGLYFRRHDGLGGVGRWGLEWLGRRDVSIEEHEFDADGRRVTGQRVVSGEQDNVAAFADHSWQLGDFDVTGGLRYDYVDQQGNDRSRSDGQLDFSVHGSWSGVRAWTLSAELGTGFRFPTLSELYFDGTTPRGDTRGNPALDPERNRALELAAVYAGAGIELRGNLYYNDLQDYIERYRAGADLLSYRNLDSAEIYGYELALGVSAWQDWTHEVSYQWQRGQDSDGNWLADLNPPALRYLLRWQGRGVTLSSDLSYRFSRDDAGPGEVPLDSAWVWNASAGGGLGPNWNLELYALNLLDELYVGSADEDAAFQPGRTFGVRFEWRRR